MAQHVKVTDGKIIEIHKGRPSFYKAEKFMYRTKKDGTLDKGTPDKPKKPRKSMTWLLDPSDAQAAVTIKEIKTEAARQLDIFWQGRENWPPDNKVTGTKGLLMCFGNGNDLPKIYDGYKDMFFIKVSDSVEPIIGDRRGRGVQFVTGDQQWHYVDKTTGQTTEEIADPGTIPYGGAYCRGRISLYCYDNEAAGVNANFRSVQFLEPGPAFGGAAGSRSAADELQAMAGDAPSTAVAATDPWE